MPDHVLVDGGRQGVEAFGAEGIGCAPVDDGVWVVGADDRLVYGQAATILSPGSFQNGEAPRLRFPFR